MIILKTVQLDNLFFPYRLLQPLFCELLPIRRTQKKAFFYLQNNSVIYYFLAFFSLIDRIQ